MPIFDAEKRPWYRGATFIGKNATNNSNERYHKDIKETYTDNLKLTINDFLLRVSKLMRDRTIETRNIFEKKKDPPKSVFKKAIELINWPYRGKRMDLEANSFYFMKKKRDPKKFADRKK